MISLTSGIATRRLYRLCLLGAALMVTGCKTELKRENDATWNRLAVLQAQEDAVAIDYSQSVDQPIWALSGDVQGGETFDAAVGLSVPAPVGGQWYVITYAVDVPGGVGQVLQAPIVNSVFVPQGAQQFSFNIVTKPVPAVCHLHYWARSQLGGTSVHGIVTIYP